MNSNSAEEFPQSFPLPSLGSCPSGGFLRSADCPILRLYAVVRTDLEMGSGKLAAQAGHAYLGAYLAALSFGISSFVVQAGKYAQELPGTKVCLAASYGKLLETREKCLSRGLPHFLVVDSGCPNFYGGEPIVTALGIGPLLRSQAKPVVGKLRLHN